MAHSEKDKFEYLDEHLPYMLKMMRHDLRSMRQDQFFLDWNSFFQSFAVNARNLVNFLTNGDKGNFKAHDFILSGFCARTGDLAPLMKKLDEQVFHLDHERPREAANKFDATNAELVATWIEEHIESFIDALTPEDQKKWNAAKAVPEERPTPSPPLSCTGPGAPPPGRVHLYLIIIEHLRYRSERWSRFQAWPRGVTFARQKYISVE